MNAKKCKMLRRWAKEERPNSPTEYRAKGTTIYLAPDCWRAAYKWLKKGYRE